MKTLDQVERRDCFYVGQVWESPRGFLYRVVHSSVGGQATLGLGADGKGRIVRRGWNAVLNWRLYAEAPNAN